jgi:hypothetical protein
MMRPIIVITILTILIVIHESNGYRITNSALLSLLEGLSHSTVQYQDGNAADIIDHKSFKNGPLLR